MVERGLPVGLMGYSQPSLGAEAMDGFLEEETKQNGEWGVSFLLVLQLTV